MAIALGIATATAAQDSTATSERSGWLTGASLGVPMANGETASELTTVGIQATHLDPGSLGFDMSVGTAPRAVADGALAIGMHVRPRFSNSSRVIIGSITDSTAAVVMATPWGA